MDYVMIERHLFDALLRGVRECRSALDAALSAVGYHRNGWVDNNSAQAILQRSTRTCSRYALPAESAIAL